MDIVEATEKFAKKNLDENTFLHTLRVKNWALKIAGEEKANLKIVELAALLHDIGKPGSSFENHHLKSAKIANLFLKENKIMPELRGKIISCIRAHMAPRKLIPRIIENFKDSAFPRPVSIEEKCLYDADLLELVGPAGFVKILNIRRLMKGAAESFLTKTAKRIAEPFIIFQNQIFKLYKKQVEL